MTENIDLLIKGWYVVTMNQTRDIIHDGAVAIRGNKIVAVGKTSELEATYTAAETIGGDRFVITPGMVNTHIHITGEPLTRGYVPDDTPFVENVFMWLCPLYAVHTAADERLSAKLAAVEMLKSGTTTFLEAGTIRFLDEVIETLVDVGIRGKVGKWIWDLPPEPDVYKQNTDDAIGNPNGNSPSSSRSPAVGSRHHRSLLGTQPHQIRSGEQRDRWPTITAQG